MTEQQEPIPGDIKGSALTTTKDYDPRVKARAFQLYLTTDLTVSDMAMELEVPQKVIMAWARNDKWAKKREDLERDFMLRAENSYRKFMAENRTEVAKRHERISSKLENAIEEVIKNRIEDGDVNEVSLKRLAEALSSVTGVSARAVGIGSASLEAARAVEENRSGKQPLVLIGVGGQLPPDTSIRVNSQEGAIIDVRESENEEDNS